MPREIGWGNAMRWLLTGDEFAAGEALRMGLVQEVVAPGEQLARAVALAESIAAQAPLGVYATLASSRMPSGDERAAAARLLPDLGAHHAERGRAGGAAIIRRAATGAFKRAIATTLVADHDTGVRIPAKSSSRTARRLRARADPRLVSFVLLRWIMRLLACLPILAACTSAPPTDAPFTGQVHRYAINSFDLPTSNQQARVLADDLDGDRQIDNQVGMVIATLGTQPDLAPNPTDLRNLLPSVIEINTHDLIDDDHVGVSHWSAGRCLDPGDRYVLGRRVRLGADTQYGASPGRRDGAARVANADPTEFPFAHGELDLKPDGSGGYTGQLRRVIDPAIALKQAALSTYQMLRANPHDHVDFAQILTGDIARQQRAARRAVTLCEHRGEPAVPGPGRAGSPRSTAPIGCRSGSAFTSCRATPARAHRRRVIDHCDDRVQDDDETDIDCGGSCHACGFDTKCEVATDCQTVACDAGKCREPSCSDGIQDGFETGVDCGTFRLPGVRSPTIAHQRSKPRRFRVGATGRRREPAHRPGTHLIRRIVGRHERDLARRGRALHVTHCFIPRDFGTLGRGGRAVCLGRPALPLHTRLVLQVRLAPTLHKGTSLTAHKGLLGSEQAV